MTIADQQLAMDKILLQIDDDIQRITDIEQGTIWLYQPDNRTIYTFPNQITVSKELERLCEQAAKSKTTVEEKGWFVVPVLWQKRLVALIGLQRGAGRSFDREAKVLLQDLADQIAPGLENAVLHAETQRQREVVEAILTGSPVGVVIVDTDNKIVRLNDHFRELIPTGEVGKGDFNRVLAEGGLAENYVTAMAGKVPQREKLPA